jgi:hypothetical protein
MTTNESKGGAEANGFTPHKCNTCEGLLVVDWSSVQTATGRTTTWTRVLYETVLAYCGRPRCVPYILTRRVGRVLIVALEAFS